MTTKKQVKISTTDYTSHIELKEDGLVFNCFTLNYKEDRQMFHTTAKDCILITLGKADISKVLVRKGHDYFSLPSDSAIIVPNFSSLDWILKSGVYEIHTLAVKLPEYLRIAQSPIVINCPEVDLPNTKEEFVLLIDEIQRRHLMTLARKLPSPLSLQAKELIDDRYMSDFKISELASQLNVSREALTRAFQRDFGMPPYAYRNGLRFSDSIAQMVSKNKPVTDTAFDLGFVDTSSFIQHFKNCYQVTPGKFRNPDKNPS